MRLSISLSGKAILDSIVVMSVYAYFILVLYLQLV
jgi:hypothetical protein